MSDNLFAPVRKCIIHCAGGRISEKLTDVSEKAFSSIKREADVKRHGELTVSESILRIIDNLPEVISNAEHGMHRECFNKFTANTARQERKRQAEENIAPCSSKVSRRSGKLDQSTVFEPLCIFCGKTQKHKKGKLEYLTKCMSFDAVTAINDAAERKKDESLLTKIRGVDLIAKEAQYHWACHRSYTRPEKSCSSTSEIPRS
jgi:hypothetical protein